MLHLWAEGGPLDIFYAKDGGPLGIWRQWAPLAQGHAMRGGHFFPEESPDDTASVLREFLKSVVHSGSLGSDEPLGKILKAKHR
jgi:haloacetate dehalogenase